jgi:hypothetical protein
MEAITNQEGAYTFRRLNSTDIFLLTKIIGKIGINEFTACLEKDTVKNLIGNLTGKESADSATTMIGISVMLEMANVVIGNISKCEVEIYQLLANVSGMTVKQIKELDGVIFFEMVLDFVAKDEFKDFIKVVSKRFGLAN